MAMTGETFIWMSVMAAVTCESAVLSLMLSSVSSRFCLMFRTCVCDVTIESMYCCCAGLAPFL